MKIINMPTDRQRSLICNEFSFLKTRCNLNKGNLMSIYLYNCYFVLFFHDPTNTIDAKSINVSIVTSFIHLSPSIHSILGSMHEIHPMGWEVFGLNTLGHGSNIKSQECLFKMEFDD